MHRLQPMAGFVELRAHLACVDERAVALVGPLMIGAYEPDDLAARLGDELGATMAAHIVEGAHLAVVAAHQDDGMPADIDSAVVARVWRFGLDAGEYPVTSEDDVEIE